MVALGDTLAPSALEMLIKCSPNFAHVQLDVIKNQVLICGSYLREITRKPKQMIAIRQCPIDVAKGGHRVHGVVFRLQTNANVCSRILRDPGDPFGAGTIALEISSRNARVQALQDQAIIRIHGEKLVMGEESRSSEGKNRAAGLRAAARAEVCVSTGGNMGSLLLTRFLQTLLFDIMPTDPLTFGVLTILLAGVAR